LSNYRLANREITVLLSPSADATEVTGKLKRLREHLAKGGEVVTQEKWGKESFLARSKYEGNVLAIGQKRFVVVLVGVGEAYEDFVEGFLSGL
jgi:hypothetical protein